MVLSAYHMAKEGAEVGQTGRVCIFDIGIEVLQKISRDEGIFHLLKKSGNVDFLDNIVMFLDLSDEDSMWVADMEKAKEEWSFELPVEITEAIKKIVEEASREKSL